MVDISRDKGTSGGNLLAHKFSSIKCRNPVPRTSFCRVLVSKVSTQRHTFRGKAGLIFQFARPGHPRAHFISRAKHILRKCIANGLVSRSAAQILANSHIFHLRSDNAAQRILSLSRRVRGISSPQRAVSIFDDILAGSNPGSSQRRDTLFYRGMNI